MENQASALATERNNLINLLHDTDYRVIKCAEANLLGQSLPYDITELHATRRQARERVGAIDAELAELVTLNTE